MIKQKITLLFILCLMCSLLACGSPEEKKVKFFSKGISLYGQGDYTKARLEFKNALQIDPTYADAWHMLGMMDMKEGKLKKAFKRLSRAVELDPANLGAQLSLGRLYLVDKNPEQTKEKYLWSLPGSRKIRMR